MINGELIMADIKFSSLNELYARLLPALNTRVKELIRDDLHYIKAEDVWNFLKETKWNNASNLLLHEMADDILCCNKNDIDAYFKDKMGKIKRDLIPDETIL